MSFKRFKQRLKRLNSDQEEITEEVKSEEVILEEMSKAELDEYALNHGIELDRRKTKINMIKDLLSKLKGAN